MENNVRHFDAQEWTNKQFYNRTVNALKQRNAQFAEENANAANGQLVSYVRKCASKLGHTPTMEEVIGGGFIAYRFKGWNRVITAARLPSPGAVPCITSRKIYKEEYQNQLKLYRQEQKEKKKQRQQEAEERSAKQEKEQREREIRDSLWYSEHKDETDEQYIEYVRQCAEELGYTPLAKEVAGGEYIRQRFGGWPVMLTVAELPLPKGMQPPSRAKLQAYLRKSKT